MERKEGKKKWWGREEEKRFIHTQAGEEASRLSVQEGSGLR